MSIAEADHVKSHNLGTTDTSVTRRPLVPPSPPRAPETMTALGRMTTMRKSAIATWGQRAYEEDVIQGSFFGRGSFKRNSNAALRWRDAYGGPPFRINYA